MDITERFLKYTTFDTQSAEESQSVPSTPKQLVFARYLKEELESEGLEEVTLDEKGYVYATLPANISDKATGENTVPVVGFIAHYDTSPDCSGKDVKARIVSNYDGSDIVLSSDVSRVLSVEKFPELRQHVGEDLIVTDGTTLLGADDKAGIAEIVQAMVFLKAHPKIRHGKIRIAFNPDEEIGMGAHHFDVEKFGCQWAYTMDGGEVGELEYENFNAASAKISITGVSVHPGYAKGKMVNASRVAAELVGLMPANETPETTEGRQGFYHLTGMQTSCEQARLTFIIRDHDRRNFEARKDFIRETAEMLNTKYAPMGATVACEISDQYYNMKEQIDPQRHIVDLATKAMLMAGVTPKVRPIRGGTDGAQLSFMGLPCPNLFAGGLNFHGPYEFVPVQSMEKAMQVVVNICALTAKDMEPF